jgi:heme A synthase
MRRHFHRLLGLALTSPLLAPATALAQNAPRDPQIGQRSPVWLGYLVAAVFGGILIVLTLLPSKRQHDDL